MTQFGLTFLPCPLAQPGHLPHSPLASSPHPQPESSQPGRREARTGGGEVCSCPAISRPGEALTLPTGHPDASAKGGGRLLLAGHPSTRPAGEGRGSGHSQAPQHLIQLGSPNPGQDLDRGILLLNTSNDPCFYWQMTCVGVQQDDILRPQSNLVPN